MTDTGLKVNAEQSYRAVCADCGTEFNCAKNLTENARRRKIAYLYKMHVELGDCWENQQQKRTRRKVAQ